MSTAGVRSLLECVPPVMRRAAAVLAALAAGRWRRRRRRAAQPPSRVVRQPGERGKPQCELGAELFAANCAALPRQPAARASPRRARGAGDVSGRARRCAASARWRADFYLRTGLHAARRRRATSPSASARALPRAARSARSSPTSRSLGGGPPSPPRTRSRGALADGLRAVHRALRGLPPGRRRGRRSSPAREAPPLDRRDAASRSPRRCASGRT